MSCIPKNPFGQLFILKKNELNFKTYDNRTSSPEKVLDCAYRVTKT